MINKPGKIGKEQLRDMAISSEQIEDNSIVNTKIADRTIQGVKMVLGAISTSEISSDVESRLLPKDNGGRFYKPALENTPFAPTSQNPFVTKKDLDFMRLYWLEPSNGIPDLNGRSPGTARLDMLSGFIYFVDSDGVTKKISSDATVVNNYTTEGSNTEYIVNNMGDFSEKTDCAIQKKYTIASIGASSSAVLFHDDIVDNDNSRVVSIIKKNEELIDDGKSNSKIYFNNYSSAFETNYFSDVTLYNHVSTKSNEIVFYNNNLFGRNLIGYNSFSEGRYINDIEVSNVGTKVKLTPAVSTSELFSPSNIKVSNGATSLSRLMVKKTGTYASLSSVMSMCVDENGYRYVFDNSGNRGTLSGKIYGKSEGFVSNITFITNSLDIILSEFPIYTIDAKIQNNELFIMFTSHDIGLSNGISQSGNVAYLLSASISNIVGIESKTSIEMTFSLLKSSTQKYFSYSGSVDKNFLVYDKIGIDDAKILFTHDKIWGIFDIDKNLYYISFALNSTIISDMKLIKNASSNTGASSTKYYLASSYSKVAILYKSFSNGARWHLITIDNAIATGVTWFDRYVSIPEYADDDNIAMSFLSNNDILLMISNSNGLMSRIITCDAKLSMSKLRYISHKNVGRIVGFGIGDMFLFMENDFKLQHGALRRISLPVDKTTSGDIENIKHLIIGEPQAVEFGNIMCHAEYTDGTNDYFLSKNPCFILSGDNAGIYNILPFKNFSSYGNNDKCVVQNKFEKLSSDMKPLSRNTSFNMGDKKYFIISGGYSNVELGEISDKISIIDIATFDTVSSSPFSSPMAKKINHGMCVLHSGNATLTTDQPLLYTFGGSNNSTDYSIYKSKIYMDTNAIRHEYIGKLPISGTGMQYIASNPILFLQEENRVYVARYPYVYTGESTELLSYTWEDAFTNEGIVTNYGSNISNVNSTSCIVPRVVSSVIKNVIVSLVNNSEFSNYVNLYTYDTSLSSGDFYQKFREIAISGDIPKWDSCFNISYIGSTSTSDIFMVNGGIENKNTYLIELDADNTAVFYLVFNENDILFPSKFPIVLTSVSEKKVFVTGGNSDSYSISPYYTKIDTTSLLENGAKAWVNARYGYSIAGESVVTSEEVSIESACSLVVKSVNCKSTNPECHINILAMIDNNSESFYFLGNASANENKWVKMYTEENTANTEGFTYQGRYADGAMYGFVKLIKDKSIGLIESGITTTYYLSNINSSSVCEGLPLSLLASSTVPNHKKIIFYIIISGIDSAGVEFSLSDIPINLKHAYSYMADSNILVKMISPTSIRVENINTTAVEDLIVSISNAEL